MEEYGKVKYRSCLLYILILFGTLFVTGLFPFFVCDKINH